MSIMHFTRDTIMSYLDTLNVRATLTPKNTGMSSPYPIDPASHGSGMNTAITLVTKPAPIGIYVGQAEIYYNRISLAELGALINNTVYMPDDITNAHGVVTYLFANHGIRLMMNEIENTTIDRTDPDNVTVLLKAHPESAAVYGEVTLTVKTGPVSLKAKFQENELGYIPSLPYTTTGYAELFSFHQDFTEIHDDLIGYVADDSAESLAPLLDVRTGKVWVSDTEAEYSTLGAVVVYNGLTTDHPTANENYTYVMEVRLTDACTNLTGNLILHYSDATASNFDPGVV